VSDTDLAGGVDAPGRARISERTLRGDRWWTAPLLTFLGLTAFVLYGLIRTATQKYYFVEGSGYSYLSPFASPCVSASCVEGSSHFGQWFGKFPAMIPLAIVTLPFLLGFRLTCYYYRKAYYRSFWLSPPACAVPEPHTEYTGETRFPLLGQNLHRYFWAVAVVISLINTYDAVKAFHGTEGFGFGLGNVILVGNVILRRPDQQLLQAPGALLVVGKDRLAQRPAHAPGVDHLGNFGVHGRLHRAGLLRHYY
jgi:hypothetical protein